MAEQKPELALPRMPEDLRPEPISPTDLLKLEPAVASSWDLWRSSSDPDLVPLSDEQFGLAGGTSGHQWLQMVGCPAKDDDSDAMMNKQLDDADLNDSRILSDSNPSPLLEVINYHQMGGLKTGPRKNRKRRDFPRVEATSHGQSVSSWHMEGWKTTGPRKTCKKRIFPQQLAGATKKNNRHWSQKEVELLVDGISEFGVGNWTKLKKKYFPTSIRTSVNLKDKWRNLLRAYDVKFKPSKKRKVQKTTLLHLEESLIERIRGLADMLRRGEEWTLSDSSMIIV